MQKCSRFCLIAASESVTQFSLLLSSRVPIAYAVTTGICIKDEVMEYLRERDNVRHNVCLFR